MTGTVLGIAALVAVAAFLTWQRQAMVRTLIEADLRRSGANVVTIRIVLGESDRYTWTYDVTYTTAEGIVVRRRCKIAMYQDVEQRVYWADPV